MSHFDHCFPLGVTLRKGSSSFPERLCQQRAAVRGDQRDAMNRCIPQPLPLCSLPSQGCPVSCCDGPSVASSLKLSNSPPTGFGHWGLYVQVYSGRNQVEFHPVCHLSCGKCGKTECRKFAQHLSKTTPAQTIFVSFEEVSIIIILK